MSGGLLGHIHLLHKMGFWSGSREGRILWMRDGVQFPALQCKLTEMALRADCEKTVRAKALQVSECIRESDTLEPSKLSRDFIIRQGILIQPHSAGEGGRYSSRDTGGEGESEPRWRLPQSEGKKYAQGGLYEADF